MNADWKSFLSQKGAVFDDDKVSSFGNADAALKAMLQGDVLCDLSQQGLIAAKGPDTVTFLQGQLTNDVRQVTPKFSQLSACCNPKGRMLACFRIFRRDDTYYLRMLRETLEPTLKRLRMFVLRAKTTLEDASDKLARFGLAGPNAENLLQDALGQVPTAVDAVIQAGPITVIRLPGSRPRFEIHGEPQALQSLWANLSSRALPAGAEPWRLLDILAGIPNVYTETTEAFVPQMVNLQLISGVSFRKGCYTGQEIVARTHYRGKLKRRMYRAHVNIDLCPKPGNALFSPQADPNQSPGLVVDACRHPDGGCELLAVVLIECAEGGTVTLGGAEGPRLEFEPLPYAFESPAA